MKAGLLFGTNNPHKLQEIREILDDTYTIYSLKDLDIDQDVEETEPTLEGNAILKAQAFFQIAQVPCFADDTGLEVDALNGAPGVITARYAGPARRAEDNMQKLLMELEGVSQRQAQFRTVIAFYDGENTHSFEGIVRGSIALSAKGDKGFGYDPVFIPEGYEMSFAEMDSDRKHSMSHRGRALEKLVNFLKTYGR